MESSLYIYFAGREMFLDFRKQSSPKLSDDYIKAYHQETTDELLRRAESNKLLSDVIQSENYRLEYQAYNVIDEFLEHRDITSHKEKENDFSKIIEASDILSKYEHKRIKKVDQEMSTRGLITIRPHYKQRFGLDAFVEHVFFGSSDNCRLNDIIFESIQTDELIDKYTPYYDATPNYKRIQKQVLSTLQEQTQRKH